MRIDFADEICRSVTMAELADRYGLQVNRSGFALCPFHTEKTPSMKIYPGNRGFACFGCGASGSVIDFVMKYEGLSFREACERLNDDFRLGLPLACKVNYRMKKKARDANRARRAVRAERDAIYKKREEALDRWCACDIALREEEPMSDRYIEAAKEIEKAAYLLDEADREVYEYEHRREENRRPGLDERGLPGR